MAYLPLPHATWERLIGLLIVVALAGLWLRSRRAQKFLKDREKYLQTIIDTAPECIKLFTADGSLLQMNFAGLKMIGAKSFEQVRGKSLTALITAPYRADFEALNRKVFQGGTGSLIFEVVGYQGQHVWLETEAAPLRDSNGKIVAALGITSNVTRRKQAEAALQQSEAKFRGVYENSPIGIEVYDSSGKLIDASPAFLKLFGISDKAEVLGFDLFSDPNLPPEAKEKLRKGEAVRREITFDFDQVRQNGLYRTTKTGKCELEIFISPFAAASGEISGFLLHVQNISEKKRAQEYLRQSAEQMAEANRLKDLFTDVLRHDILNPVSAIRANTELLLRTEGDSKRAAILENIRASTSALIDMTENAAKYAKLAVTGALDLKPLDLNACLREVAAEFDHPLREKRMQLALPAEGKAMAAANPMVKEVFSNLVSNAIKYSRGGTKIEVELLDEGKDWVIAVKDCGDGIPDLDKKRIFNRFERLKKEGVKGSGLGLSIAKQIIVMHGGEIWVEDNPAGGSIFKVRLRKGHQ